jgi:prepilin-type N-terminal cleavage/methylation domain-containing protein
MRLMLALAALWEHMYILLRFPDVGTQYALIAEPLGRLRLVQAFDFDMKKNGFTLIELIIVVVIIGILALIAIPKYFANVDKAQKAQVYASLKVIRDAELAYYAVYGVYLTGQYTWPIKVIVDEETIYNLSSPSNTNWVYARGNDLPGSCTNGMYVYAYKQPGNSCWLGVCTVSGNKVGTCP